MQGRRRTTLMQAPYAQFLPEVSPDGRWMAYGSAELGQFGVYVVPFSNVNGDKWPISTDFGLHHTWSRDGSKLFYRGERAMMSVSIDVDPEFTPGSQHG